MADTTVHVTTLNQDAATADVAGTAIDAAKVGVIALTKPSRKVVIRITHTAAAAHDITITKGDSNPAQSAGQGDLVVNFGIGSVTPVVKYFVLESARFLHDDGCIRITYAAGTTGFVEAFQLP